MLFLHSTLVGHHLQTLGLLLEKMQSPSLSSFELLAVSCIVYYTSIIMRHVNSMHTIHTVHTINDHSKISKNQATIWEITTWISKLLVWMRLKTR